MSSYHLGRYQDVLADVVCDAVIADPPFGERTHAGAAKRGGRDDIYRTEIDYQHWTKREVEAFVEFWSPRTSGWIVALSCSDLAHEWRAAFDAVGRYSFAPVPCVTLGMGVRMTGDGPSSWATYLNVGRPRSREYSRWGALPGFYQTKRESRIAGGGRGKPLDLMCAIVRDYSRPGALVCDPCGGLASTGVAALSMGRKFVGAEMDAETHAKGLARLQAVVPVDLFDQGRAKQVGLL